MLKNSLSDPLPNDQTLDCLFFHILIFHPTWRVRLWKNSSFLNLWSFLMCSFIPFNSDWNMLSITGARSGYAVGFQSSSFITSSTSLEVKSFGTSVSVEEIENKNFSSPSFSSNFLFLSFNTTKPLTCNFYKRWPFIIIQEETNVNWQFGSVTGSVYFFPTELLLDNFQYSYFSKPLTFFCIF